MQLIGYKCFNNDLTNRYGKQFEVGKIYTVNGDIKFGNNGNGFHMCKNMEDTLRYFDAMNNIVNICEVIGTGDIVKYHDEYYGYYDMYAVSKLEILKKLTREQVIAIALNLPIIRVQRFLSLYKLNENELDLFKDKFVNEEDVQKIIEYYQENKLDAFVKGKGFKNG